MLARRRQKIPAIGPGLTNLFLGLMSVPANKPLLRMLVAWVLRCDIEIFRQPPTQECAPKSLKRLQEEIPSERSYEWHLRFLENLTDYFKKAENGVFSAILKLFADLVDGEHGVGVIEEDAPLAFLLFPCAPISMNHAFAEIRAEDLNKLFYSIRTAIFCASCSFNESVKPFHRLAVVTERRVWFVKLTNAVNYQLRMGTDLFFWRHCLSLRKHGKCNHDLLPVGREPDIQEFRKEAEAAAAHDSQSRKTPQLQLM